MKHRRLQNSAILIVSILLGCAVFLQYKTLAEHSVDFVENNPFREIRTLLNGNAEMRESIQKSEQTLQTLSSQEAIEKNAQQKTEEAKDFSGMLPLTNAGVDIIVEGNITLKNMISFVNTLWNAGAKNIELNSVKMTFNNAGFDQAGGQILLGSTPLSAPYFFKVYGDPVLLSQVLNPETGALRTFTNDGVKISLSLREK